MDLASHIIEAERSLTAIEERLSQPETLSNPSLLKELGSEHSRLSALVQAGKNVFRLQDELNGAKELFSQTADEDFRREAEAEITRLQAEIPQAEALFLHALLPTDPLDQKNIIVEIRAGTGGDEAALFAADLFRMYQRYAEAKEWNVSLISSSQNDLGGFKEILFSIKGDRVYSHLKYEAGVHRVQRVPTTEKQGRVHTSTATVAILPEAEEVDVHLDPKEIVIETSTSTGAGGQSVNTTYSAIRVTHLPTGIVVQCQDERSQQQNRERALSILRARLFQHMQDERNKERSDARRDQIGSGNRSEKIRTYNVPQDRVTDHRIEQNFFNIPSLLQGNIGEIIETLQSTETKERLARIEVDQV